VAALAGLTQGQAQWDSFVLDLQSGELRRRGLRVRLQEVPFRVLAVLLERPGETVTREELHRELWEGYSYGDFDHSLNIAINKLRAALSDSARRPRYIETLPRRGYRFIAPVEKTDVVARTRLAVLPFANLGGAPEEDYFCDGVTEEMITHLGRLSPEKLGVIARTSSMHFKNASAGVDEIGRQLGVDYLLEGSVRSQESLVRINVQLVQVKDQTQLWSDSFERLRTDVFEIQREVAQRVAASLALELLPDQHARLARKAEPFTAAHEDYLRGRYQVHKRTEEGFRQALLCFASALEKDPNHGPAYAGSASANMLLASHALASPQEVFPRARAAALKALVLDPQSSEAHAALMFTHAYFDWDFAAAERQYALALEQGAASADLFYFRGFYLPALARFNEAVSEMQRALRLDPLLPALNANLCFALYLGRRYDQAISQGEAARRVEPSFWLTRVRLGRAYLQRRMHRKGVAEHEEAMRLSGAPPVHKVLLAYAYAFTGQQARARAILSEVLQLASRCYVSPYFIAEVYSALGETDRAIEYLEKSFAERSPWLAYLRVEPALDRLRTDPRFDELLSRVGLPRVKLPLRRPSSPPAGRGGA